MTYIFDKVNHFNYSFRKMGNKCMETFYYYTIKTFLSSSYVRCSLL